MQIEQQNLDEFVRPRLQFALGSPLGARRMVDDDLRRFWDFYERYERAVAEVGNVLSPHHAMGSILQQLSNWQLYDLDSALRRELARESGHSGPWPIGIVREAFRPLRSLATAVISDANERLGPVPPLEAVPLLDLDWLGVVAATGQAPADPEPPVRPPRSDFAVKLATWPGTVAPADEPSPPKQSAKRRETISDFAVALAGLSAAADCRAAIEQSDFGAAEKIRRTLWISARGCRAPRVRVGTYDIARSLAIGDRDEALAGQAALERACAETVTAAKAFLRLVRPGPNHD